METCRVYVNIYCKFTTYFVNFIGDVIYKIASSTLLSKLDVVCHSPSALPPKPHIPPTIATCMLSSAGPRYVFVARPTGSRSSTSLLGKAPPYVSSLGTIATPTRSTHSSRYISLVIPKANTSFGHLSFQFSAANDWNELQKSPKLETYISLTNFKHQLSEQLTNCCCCT